MSKTKDLTRQKIYLAALLHDIGKFYQRASANRNKEAEVWLKYYGKQNQTSEA